jgi:hypothetical protein
VFPPILEHINQRVPNFSGCCEPAGVVAITPHRPATAERTVHRLRHPDGQTLDPVTEAGGPFRLDEEMDVVALDAEMQEPEDVGGGGGQRRAHGRKDHGRTERR